MSKTRYGEEYHTYFDPKTFLELFYKNFKEDEDVFMLPFVKAVHEFWSSFIAPKESAKVRYLEFGGGPSITNLVVACPKVDHIVFAEYTEANRQAVKSWIAGEPGAHDWTPLIEFVLQLERGAKEESNKDEEKFACVSNRADELKRKIKFIIPCDATKAPIVELDTSDVAKLFDVVSSSLCLEVCSLSEIHYKNTVTELGKLLKPNGYLFMNGVLEETFYFVDKEKFYSFPLTEKLVREAMNEAALEIEKFVTIPVNCTDETWDGKALYYAYGKKCAEK